MSAEAAALALSGKLYRALNPIWAREPLSGEGAARHGGRFNSRGVPALYCSLSPVTALREAHQAGDLQPITLVSYDAAIDRVFDSRNKEALAQAGGSAEALADPGWRDLMKRQGETPTQTFARNLIAADWHGLLVRSFARGAGEDDLNVMLWRWGSAAPHRLTLIDDENRLRR